MAPVIPDPTEIKTFRTEAAFETLADSESRPRDRDLAEDPQEGLRPADGDRAAGAGRRAVLGLDRRHPQVVRRAVVPAALHAAAAEEHLEPDQPRPRRAADRRRPHDAARPATGRRRQGGRPLGCRLRADAQRERATIPDDLRAAIDANPRARKTFRTLGRQNLFALAFRTNNMKTPAGRARKIAALVAMLARGETIIPERPQVRQSGLKGR